MQFMAEEIARRGWDRGTIGVETDDYYYTAKWDALLREGLPGATFVDAFLLVNWCRMKKSARELAITHRLRVPYRRQRRIGVESVPCLTSA